MADFAFEMNRTSSTTLDIGSVLTAAANPRRFALFSFTFGSEATPADVAFLVKIDKRTGTATAGSGVTGVPLDDADTTASTLIGNEAPTTNGAGSGVKLAVPVNQRFTFYWFAIPGHEMRAAAVADSGMAIETPTISTGTPIVTSTFHVTEY